MNYQRDAFISELRVQATDNQNIVFLSADFGAPALDQFITDLPDQFCHLGISEQNMVDVAIGMAMRGKRVFSYAMAPSVLMRCAEQHKLAAIMDLPITTIVAGVGFSYANAGPTHYATEDLSIAMNLIGSNVYTMSDASLAGACASYLSTTPEFCFVRLDRMPGDDLCSENVIDITRGYRSFFSGKKLAIISHGYLLKKAHSIVTHNSHYQSQIKVFDLFRCKPISEDFVSEIAEFETVLVLDEQITHSSLGIYLYPQILRGKDSSKIKSLSLADNYMFQNVGRDGLLSEAGLCDEVIEKEINSLISV